MLGQKVGANLVLILYPDADTWMPNKSLIYFLPIPILEVVSRPRRYEFPDVANNCEVVPFVWCWWPRDPLLAQQSILVNLEYSMFEHLNVQYARVLSN